MTTAIDHAALPFDEIEERRMLRCEIPEDGMLVCQIMQDGWPIGVWIESDYEGPGPVARKILAVNDLLVALRESLDFAKRAGIHDDPDGKPCPRYARGLAAIAKAEAE